MNNNSNPIVKRIMVLNKGVIIKPSFENYISYTCSIPCNKLVLPKGFVYNGLDNSITDNKTGNSIQIKYDLGIKKEDELVSENIPVGDLLYKETLRKEYDSKSDNIFESESIPEYNLTSQEIELPDFYEYDDLFESDFVSEFSQSNTFASETIDSYKNLEFDRKIDFEKDSEKEFSEDYYKYVTSLYKKPKTKIRFSFKKRKRKRSVPELVFISSESEKRKELLITNVNLVKRCKELIRIIGNDDLNYEKNLLTSLIIHLEKSSHNYNSINELNKIKEDLTDLTNLLCNKYLKKEHLQYKKNSI